MTSTMCQANPPCHVQRLQGNGLNQAACLLPPAAPLPAPLTKGLLEAGLALGRSVAAAVTPLRAQAVQTILSAGDSLRLQFPKEDLGFCYAYGAVLQETTTGDRTTTTTSNSSSGTSGYASRRAGAGYQQSQGMTRGQPYIPSTQPGCRLPHVELQLLPSRDMVGSRQGRKAPQLTAWYRHVCNLDALAPSLFCSMKMRLCDVQRAQPCSKRVCLVHP
jgi:hypothetical protein